MKEPYSKGISIAELLGIMKNHIALLIVVFIGVMVLSLGYALISTTYTATITISVEPVASLVRNTGTKTTATNIVNELQYLNSRSVVTKTLYSMDLSAYTRRDGTDYSDLLLEEEKLKSLIENIELFRIEGSNQVSISFEHANPEFAKDFIVALHNMFDATLLDLSVEQLDKEHDLLARLLKDAEANLEASELARDEFQINPKYVEYNANSGSYNRILSFLEIRLQDVKSAAFVSDPIPVLKSLGITDHASVKLVEAYGQDYRKLLYYEIGQLINPTKSNEIESKDYYLELYRGNLENRRLILLDHLTLLQGEIEAEALLPQIINTVEYSSLATEKQYYLDSLKEFRSIGILGDRIQYELNQHKSKVVQYTIQLKSFEDNRSIAVDPTSIVEPIQIIDLDGNTKKTSILAVGLLFGLALSLFCVLFYDTVSDSLTHEIGVKRLVNGQIPIWSTIPKIKKKNLDSGLSANFKLQSKTSEAFSRLAGIVQYGDTSSSNSAYCFSSLGYGESSVSTVLNLAFSLLKNGKRVLMIGTNSEETNYQDKYDTSVASDSSVSKISLDTLDLDSIRKMDAKLPLLHLASIDGDPHELSLVLNSETFSNHVKIASEVYDVVLIDGPTFRSPSNLLAVGKSSTGLVLHLRQGIASKNRMKQLLETVSISQIPVLGIVFNAMFGRPSFKERRRIKKLNIQGISRKQ